MSNSHPAGTSASALRAFGRSRWRRDWRALVLLALAVACAGGLVMSAAIGARRARSAWERFARATRSPDVFTEVPVASADAALVDLVARPGVEAGALMGFMVVVPQGRVPADAKPPGAFVGLSPGFGTTIYRPLILAGRPADPTRADEFTINEAMAELTGLRPGDRVTLVSYPPTVNQPATVVGIQAGALDVTLNSGNPTALMTPAFGVAWFDSWVAALKPSDRSQYKKVLMARVPGSDTRAALLANGFSSGRNFGSEAIAALNAQRTAFSVLTIAGIVGTLLAVGQAVSRRVRRDADQLPVLDALGLTPRLRQAAIGAAPWAAAAFGFMVAPLVGFIATPLVATGVARRLELGRPHVTDLAVMLPGAAAGIVVVAVVAFFAARRTDAQPRTPRPHPAPVRLPGPAGLLGGRVASGWSTPAARTVARSHVAGVAFALAAITGVTVWSGAARHLVSTPARYGVTWDAVIGQNEGEQVSPDPSALDSASERLSANPRVGIMVARVVAGMYQRLGDTTEIVEIDRKNSTWWPPLIAGRAPLAGNEITVGSAIPGVKLGDTVDIGQRTMTVVGKHVMPPLDNGSAGFTVAMLSGTGGPSLSPVKFMLLVRLARGATLDDLQQVAGSALVVFNSADSRPGDVTNLGRTAGLIDVLLLACIVLGLAAFANGLIVATRSRRDDYATLRSLGAQHRTIAGSVAWHGALVVLIGAVVGIPVGLIVGRTVWRRTASGINAIPDLWRWPADGAAVAAATVLLAGLVVVAATAIPGLRPSTRRPE